MTPNELAPVLLGESRVDALPEINGLAAVYYREGDPGTQYQLWAGAVERVMPGAFKGALAGTDDVRALSNHNPDKVLGRLKAGTLRLTDSPEGLRYSIDPGNTTAGRDAVENIGRKDVTGSSFSFHIVAEEWWTEEIGGVEVDIRELREVKTFDVGPVTFQAYDATSVGLKSAGEHDEARASHDAWKARGADRVRRAKALEVGTRVAELESA